MTVKDLLLKYFHNTFPSNSFEIIPTGIVHWGDGYRLIINEKQTNIIWTKSIDHNASSRIPYNYGFENDILRYIKVI